MCVCVCVFEEEECSIVRPYGAALYGASLRLKNLGCVGLDALKTCDHLGAQVFKKNYFKKHVRGSSLVCEKTHCRGLSHVYRLVGP